jgi:hypothetical protein
MKMIALPVPPGLTHGAPRLRPPRCVAALCGLWLALLSAAAPALTAVSRPFPELVQQAELIVIGTVAALDSAWSADHALIYTTARLVDLEVIKGAVPTVPYELRLPGGVVGTTAQKYPGMPPLKQGERYVLFVRGETSEFFPLVGAYQGLYRVLTDTDGQQRVLRADQRDTPVVRALTLPAQPTLDEFVARVRDQMNAAPPESGASGPASGSAAGP